MRLKMNKDIREIFLDYLNLKQYFPEWEWTKCMAYYAGKYCCDGEVFAVTKENKKYHLLSYRVCKKCYLKYGKNIERYCRFYSIKTGKLLPLINSNE